ncbi:hypothetical protein HNY73_013744 [Argiope bruennichi]|uniref:Uncharacterized protein n=1 Tax=Argiope bruennichi TaxID=94029 RepID=A0A8T0ES06_ARGBR|nr:hypothetical protein HNY73_013744 [Argiope bruennichi]
MPNLQKHSEYKIFVSDFNKNYHCTFNAFDQEKICAEICQIPTGFWSKELEDNKIHLTDQECLASCSSSTIHLLIGADIAGKLMTGKILNLACGLTATETLLGWTLMGRAPSKFRLYKHDSDQLTYKDCNISDLCKFNLRGWQSNASLEIIDQPDKHQAVPLLGLNWNLKQDTLSCCPKDENVVLTKRGLLSLVHSISSPITITPKFMLQESWNLGLKWEDALPEGLSKRFWNCLTGIKNLLEVKIPRWMKLTQGEEETVSLHVFCGASAKAYATCIFLRVEFRDEVFVSFVQSRARVWPLKNLKIHLELLSSLSTENFIPALRRFIARRRRFSRLYALEVQTPAVENLLEKRASEIEDEKEEAVQQQYAEHPEKLPESDKTSLPNLNTMKTRFGRKIQVPKRLDL